MNGYTNLYIFIKYNIFFIYRDIIEKKLAYIIILVIILNFYYKSIKKKN